MKNILLIALSLFMLTACGNGGQKKQNTDTTTETKVADANTVYVYYFHGKQRCKTCIAVGNVAKETVEAKFAGNDQVRFIEVNTSEKENDALVEKYDVSWNALIIAKGEESKDITEQAFATAVSSPEKLTEEITTIVKSMSEAK